MSRVESVIDLKKARTEDLRKWVREDNARQHLLVLVHGFNSSITAAWGDLPALVKEDPEFAGYNILLFGYPTEVCGQVADIGRSGELLSSYLKDVAPDYDAVLLVGHSMGGLVILNGLLTLEQDAPMLLERASFKVLTFGTPHAGVPGANLLPLLCRNRQVEGMEALNDTLSRLHKTWQVRFGEGTGKGADPRRIPVSPFFGHADEFVPRGSACAGFEKYCEAVDGNHATMVKPDAKAQSPRDHLTYRKLKAARGLLRATVPPTPQGKIGIWAARFRGDKDDFAAQRDTVQDLGDAIAKEQDLKDGVEVRELPRVIEGSTDVEKEQEAKRLGARYNAAVVIWGEITAAVGNEVLRPRVTVITNQEQTITESTVRLGSVTKAMREQELTQLNLLLNTTQLPPQRIREPLRLARFMIALAFFQQGNWNEAAQRFDQFIAEGIPHNVKAPVIYAHSGFSHFIVYRVTSRPEALTKAESRFKESLDQYRAQQDWVMHANTLHWMGMMYRHLVEWGVDPMKNRERAVTTFEEVAPFHQKHKDWTSYAMAKKYLGVTYQELAIQDVESVRNLDRSATALREAAPLYQEQKNWDDYAKVQNILGKTHEGLAFLGVESEQNRKHAVEAFANAARIREDLKDWGGYVAVQNNQGKIYLILAGEGTEKRRNLELAREAYEKSIKGSLNAKDQTRLKHAIGQLKVVLRMLIAEGVEAEKYRARMDQLEKEGS